MSLIVTEIYDALIEAGATERKARAAATAIPMVENLATKQDLAELKAATRQDLAEFKAATRQDLAEFKAAIKQDLAEFKAATKKDLAELRAEFKEDISVLKRDVAVLKLAVFSFFPTIVALLVKLVFFP